LIGGYHSSTSSKIKNYPPSIDEKSTEAACVIRRSKGYVLVSDKLYKHGSGIGVFMKCVPTEEGKDILQEIHEGTCGNLQHKEH
jgi:hypothetical protein